MVFAASAAAETPGVFFVPDSVTRAAVTAGMTSIRDGAVYDRHAAGLYRQALLTLGDAGMAEQVVSDVILVECLRSAPDGDTEAAAFRLRISACRRCQALAGDTAWRSRDSGRRPRGSVLDRIALTGLSGRERAALALVIFGGFGYADAARELAIAPKDMAALLCAVLFTLTAAGAPA
jgi:DNA-directed RNA polymerase specialized sigma24 family protein